MFQIRKKIISGEALVLVSSKKIIRNESFRSLLIPKEFCRAVLAIGNFDGLHIGHKKVIETAKIISLKNKNKVGVMTFEPHPKSFFRKQFDFFRLTPFRMKYELLKKN